MAITEVVIDYRRFLKRRNYSRCTLRNYINTLKHFVLWVDVPIEQVTHKTILSFIDHLLNKRLQPKTINCYLDSVRSFYDYLIKFDAGFIPGGPRGQGLLMIKSRGQPHL
jgi:site-specific recombinase XerD